MSKQHKTSAPKAEDPIPNHADKQQAKNEQTFNSQAQAAFEMLADAYRTNGDPLLPQTKVWY